MDNRTILTDYVRRMTSALMQQGVKAVVISPGSRSTPLAYALHRRKALMSTCKSMNDQPAILHWGWRRHPGTQSFFFVRRGLQHRTITLPSRKRIMRAFRSIVITADRPHELREVGAPQAIDQIRMYGQHVKYSVDFPLAEQNPDIDDFIDRQISRALAVATTMPWGPVHLNVPFREPLLIDFELGDTGFDVYQTAGTETLALDTATAEHVKKLLRDAERGLIIAGELPVGFDKEAFWKFAETLQWPVLCDPLSNFRSEVPEAMYDFASIIMMQC